MFLCKGKLVERSAVASKIRKWRTWSGTELRLIERNIRIRVCKRSFKGTLVNLQHRASSWQLCYFFSRNKVPTLSHKGVHVFAGGKKIEKTANVLTLVHVPITKLAPIILILVKMIQVSMRIQCATFEFIGWKTCAPGTVVSNWDYSWVDR